MALRPRPLQRHPAEAAFLARSGADRVRPEPDEVKHDPACPNQATPLLLDRVTGVPPDYSRRWAVFVCIACHTGTVKVWLD